MPRSSAAAAPVNANSAVPCTANDIRRITISGPSVPATSPSTAAAASAISTKSSWSRRPVSSKSNSFSISGPSTWESSRAAGPDRLVVVGVVVVVVHGVLAQGALRSRDVDLPAHAHDLDLGTVELRQRRRRHHLRGGAHPEPPADEVEHPVHVRQHGVDLVR